MKKAGFVLLVSALILLVGCTGSSVKEEVEVKKEKALSALTARDYIEGNVFIKMGVDEIEAATRTTTERAVDDAKWKAALYRFYKNVEMTDEGIDVCKLTSGAEVNMSEDLFQALRSDMERFNDVKRKQKADGINAINQSLNEEYFEGLLK